MVGAAGAATATFAVETKAEAATKAAAATIWIRMDKLLLNKCFIFTKMGSCI
jgi:hypothetical protein